MPAAHAIFLSDIHLGTRACQATRLLELLRRWEAPRIYLVGDIIDLWEMRRGIHWPESHNTVLQKLLRRARQGVEVTFIPGNHDALLRMHAMQQFGNVRLVAEAIHETVDGRRLVIMHGDEFDPVTRYPRLQALLGEHSYHFMMWSQRKVQALGLVCGIQSHFSLARLVRTRLARARRYIEDFERAALHHAATSGFDGIVCGHIHHPTVLSRDNLGYYNCGDWVDSCTALIEHLDGRFELVHQSLADMPGEPTIRRIKSATPLASEEALPSGVAPPRKVPVQGTNPPGPAR